MIESEYRKSEGLNNSLLKRFNPIDQFLKEPIEYKPEFRIGKAFEADLIDFITGKCEFGKLFAVSKLPEILQDRRTVLKGKGVDGEEWRCKPFAEEEEYEKENGRELLKTKEAEQITRMIKNTLGLKIKFFEGTEYEVEFSVEDLVKNGLTSYPIYWEENGVKMKAELDLVVEYGNLILPFDFKTHKESPRSYFKTLLSLNNWIDCEYEKPKYLRQGIEGWQQDLFYKKACQARWPNKIIHDMTFIVTEKPYPSFAQSWRISDEYTRDVLGAQLRERLRVYSEWKEAGKPILGHVPEVGQAKFFVE